MHELTVSVCIPEGGSRGKEDRKTRGREREGGSRRGGEIEGGSRRGGEIEGQEEVGSCA